MAPGKRQDPAQPPLDDGSAPLLDVPEDPDPAAISRENPHGLRPRERLFVAAFFAEAGFHAAKAYRLAGFTGTEASVTANASRLIRTDRVSREIQDRLRAREAKMSGEEALERISAIGRGDIGLVLPAEHPIAKLPPAVRVLIKSVTPMKNGFRIEMYDSLRANELIAKVSGLLKESVTVEHSLEALLAASQEPPSVRDVPLVTSGDIPGDTPDE